MKRIVSLCAGVLMCLFSTINYAKPNLIELSRSVVKIQAVSTTGKQNMGSGVVVDSNKIATNCHVTRAANYAYVIKEDRLYSVIAFAAEPELDICILKIESVSLPVAPLVPTGTVKMQDQVSVYGYPYALGIRMMPGKIIGLHAYAENKIIEINAGFTHGASGGGVFNNDGELVGLMTFIGQTENKMHFYVVPSAWIEKALKNDFSPLSSFSTPSFWEKGRFEHP